jgi:hypothetical protein
VNLLVAATGAFATIFTAILILDPTTVEAMAIVAGSCLVLATSAWLGDRWGQQPTQPSRSP